MLSALLLGAAKKSESELDKSLESIFKTSAKSALTSSQPTVVRVHSHAPGPLVKKRKRHDSEGVAHLDEIEKRTTKKSKQERLVVDDPALPLTSETRSKKVQAISEPLLSIPGTNLPTPKLPPTKSLKGPRHDIEKKTASPPVYTIEQEEGRRDEDAGESSDDEHTTAPLVHETIINDGMKSSVATRSRSAYVPSGETKEQREARTVFIGNVPIEVAKSRPYQKALKQHLLALCATPTSDGPNPKIESIRFRSVAFKIPTTKIPADGDKPSGKQSEPRQRARTITWGGKKDDGDPDKVDPVKVYLTPAQRKKIAFIKGDLHEEAGSINSYVVFAHPHPVNQSDEKKGHRYQPVMDPFEAAKLLVARADGSTFMNRTLRVDLVRSLEEEDAAVHGLDPHFTVFVGNLDFTAHEEDLHAYFESVVVAEQGPPPENIKSWVQGVRIIRDKDTQLGKGFAYVKFANRSCVDEIVSTEAGKLKFAKRRLRVQRCKGTTGPSQPGRGARGSRQQESVQKSTIPKQEGRRSASDLVWKRVKGDPKLGERLKGLSKEDRKEAKKSDVIRQARRLDKKKEKAAHEKAMSGKDKERVRTRKTKQTVGLKKHGKHKRSA